MSWIVSVDRVTVSLFEKVAHSLQRNFGVHPCSIAYGGIAVYGCTSLMTWIIPGYSLLAKIMFGGILFFITVLNAFIVFPEMKREIDQDAENGLSNKHKVDEKFSSIRVLSCLVLVFQICFLFFVQTYILRDLNDVFMFSGFVVYIHFLSVDPLPPGPSRFRKWIESTFQRRRLAYIESR